MLVARQARQWVYVLLVIVGVLISFPGHATVIDRSDWLLHESPSVLLEGSWLAIPGRLMETLPSAFEELEGKQAWLPAFFGDARSGVDARQTVVTYATRLRLPKFEATQALMIRFHPSDTAARYRVTTLDGTPLSPIVSQGRPGADLASTLPKRVPSLLPLDLDLPDEVVVWMEIANFHQEIGGTWGTPQLWDAEQAFRAERVRSMVDGVMIGLMTIFALYHLILYAQGRREKVLLSFALLCALVAVRSAVMARYPESMVSEWSVFHYEFWLKVELMTLPLSVLTFAYYFRSFSDHFIYPKLIWRVVLVTALVLLALIVVSPSTFSSNLLSLLQTHMILGVIWIVWRLVVAWRDNVNYINYVLIGGLILGGTVVQDTLHSMGVWETGHYAHYVFGLFLFLQSLIISRRHFETVNERNSLTERVLKQATMLAHESDKRALAEGAQREAEYALRVQTEARMTLFGEAVHHINNPLNHILGSLHGIAARQSDIRKLTGEIFDEDELLSPEALAVKRQYEDHFEGGFDFYESATSAVERAASTVQLLRALSGIDGVSYKSIYLGDIWSLVESRSAMVAKLIDTSTLEGLFEKRCLGHPAMYAQALELLINSYVVEDDAQGFIECDAEDEPVSFRMKRAMEEGAQETSGKALRLRLRFEPRAHTKDSEKVLGIVRHLLEPYGSQVDLEDGVYRLTILTEIAPA